MTKNKRPASRPGEHHGESNGGWHRELGAPGDRFFPMRYPQRIAAASGGTGRMSRSRAPRPSSRSTSRPG
ncbi:MAG TPA: hypothetical protein VGG40_13230 [Solirubrobacterales bacterium]